MEKELTIDILSSVQKPARYTGGEFNSIVKSPEETEVSIALAFPDIYEVGMSYLGFKILYHILNLENGVAAERVYAPWVDLEAKMRANAIPLRTLETEKILQDFDFVGFTLQYELSYTNILNMLDLGRIPVKTEERTEKDPFIIVGGPCVYNPEPLADFFDLAVVGEGEEVMVELMEAYKRWKREGKPGGRQGFLRCAVKLKGIYVPSFYDVAYNEDGTVAAVVANCDAAPAAVEKRVISDMNTVNYPTAPIVPFGEIVHDRIMLEVFRGCRRGRAGGGHPAADGGLRTVKQKNPQMGVLLSFCGIVKVCQQIPLGHLKDLTQAGQLIILDKPAVSLNFADKRLVNVHAQQLQLGGQFLLGEPALLPKLSEAFGNEIGLGVVIGLVHVLHQHDIFS